MPVRFCPQTLFPTALVPNQGPNLRRALKMLTVSGSKRPTCPSCSKPATICLCGRLRNPALENQVSVTILQHTLERNHPLNSARIARIGLKNVTVATVSDANFGARFDIRLLEPGLNGPGSVRVLESEGTQKPVSVQNDGFGSGNSVLENSEEKSCNSIGSSVECSSIEDVSGILGAEKNSTGSANVEFSGMNPFVKQPNSDISNDAFPFNEAISDDGNFNKDENDLLSIGRIRENPVMTITVDKYGCISELITETDRQKLDGLLDLAEVLPSLQGIDALAKGFVVKKLQKRSLKDCVECEEFELKIPAGSVLLFPSAEALSVDELKLNGLEVKNLIVLDGTWAKAKRMYSENPWLKVLPHLRLDLDKMSLYAEVRTQPKAGYLSTIESIVYAMKAIGDEHEELDDLLDVFESMIGDQRRCKDARLSKESIE